MNEKYGPLILRLGLAFVFIWFGINQLISPEGFFGYVPNFLSNQINLIILLNGIFDTIIGLALLIGFKVRIITLIKSVQLTAIIITLGYNDVAIRDIGILFAGISLFFLGPDEWTLDKKKLKASGGI